MTVNESSCPNAAIPHSVFHRIRVLNGRVVHVDPLYLRITPTHWDCTKFELCSYQAIQWGYRSNVGSSRVTVHSPLQSARCSLYLVSPPSFGHSAQWDTIRSTAMTRNRIWAVDPFQIAASNGLNDYEYCHTLSLSVTISLRHCTRNRQTNIDINARARCGKCSRICPPYSSPFADKIQSQCHWRQLFEWRNGTFGREIE